MFMFSETWWDNKLQTWQWWEWRILWWGLVEDRALAGPIEIEKCCAWIRPVLIISTRVDLVEAIPNQKEAAGNRSACWICGQSLCFFGLGQFVWCIVILWLCSCSVSQTHLFCRSVTFHQNLISFGMKDDLSVASWLSRARYCNYVHVSASSH